MPRYVATVLPALLLIAAVLIDRQPARWLRVLTLLVFAAVNLSQFGTRVFGYSEPPSDRIARDILDAQPQSQFLPNQPAAPTFRTYLSISGRFAGAAPGAGSYPTTPTAYYLRISSGVESHPQEIRTMAYFSRFQRWDRNSPQSIAADLKRSPQIRQFVVWTALPAGTVDETDLLAESLAGKFKRTREELFPARDHWTWINRFTARRREYVRVEE
jgi:hypothetical protein